MTRLKGVVVGRHGEREIVEALSQPLVAQYVGPFLVADCHTRMGVLEPCKEIQAQYPHDAERHPHAEDPLLRRFHRLDLVLEFAVLA